MRRLNLPLILDTFFVGACAFLFTFTFVRFYLKDITVALVLAIALALVFGGGAFLHISFKQNKKLLLADDEKAKEMLALHLSVIPPRNVMDTFLQLYPTFSVSGNRLENHDAVMFLVFKMRAISGDDVAELIKYETDKNKILLCNTAEVEAEELASYFGIEIRKLTELYPELKSKGLLPKSYAYVAKKKLNAFKRIKARFKRKTSLPLFTSGLGMLAFSYFTFYSTYYLIVGGTLLMLSCVFLLFGKKA